MDLNQDSSVEKIKAITELLIQANKTKLDQDATKDILKNLGIIPQEKEVELVCGKSGGRLYLLKTFEEAESRIILQYPWMTNRIFADGDRVMTGLRYALDRGIQVDLGFGYREEIGTLIRLDRNGKLTSSDGKYGALKTLLSLQGHYPDHLRLKLTGDHSKYCVCDHKFTYVGSHNSLSSTVSDLTSLIPMPKSGELGMVVRVKDSIQKVITYYDATSDLTHTMLNTKMRLAA